MDVNAGRILNEGVSLENISQEIFDLACRVCVGDKTKAEVLGHVGSILTYKSFEPIASSCLPHE